MTHTTSGYLELDAGTIYYETAGAGVPLVLSHAAFLDSRMFNPQWEALAQHFQVIRYDMRGYGRSSAVDGPICRRDDLRRLLEYLDIDHAHFVGCSNGGAIMLDLVLEQPELARSLMLVGAAPSGFEIEGEPPRYMLEMFAAAQAGAVDQTNELQIRIWLDGEYREPDAVDSTLRQQALAMNRIPVEQQTFLIADMQPVCLIDPPAVVRLHDIQCPVLIVAGALDHAEVLRAASKLTEGISTARKIVVENAGHVPSFEQPEVFNALLLDFLCETELTPLG